MATYKEKVGTSVVNYAGNYPGAVDGELWYDSTNKDFKYQYANVTAAGSWRTSSNINTGRDQHAAASYGTPTAALTFGGQLVPGSVINNTETWNGSNWTEVNNLTTARDALYGSGTYTSSIASGGYNGSANVTDTEVWNGTNWTEVNNLGTARRLGGSSGISSTSALATSGYTSTNVANVESWNGTNWTEVNDVNSARRGTSSFGTQTSSLFSGGYTTTAVAITESWNGTNWTEVGDLNTARGVMGSGADNTTGLVAGGSYISGSGKTELWNGTSWSEQNDLSIARNSRAGSGASGATAALAISGQQPGNPAFLTAVEEWIGAGAPVGAWSTGGSLNQDRYAMSSSGTVTASIAFGGRISPPNAYSAANESYDGTSWTEVNNLVTARNAMGSTTGPYTAVLGMGGNDGGNTSKVESWNGTNWTEITGLNTAKSNVAGCGTTTAALATGGSGNTNELWNGSNWTEVNDLNTARNGIGPNSSGTSTATLVAGGEQPGPPYALYANSELWNGTNWTEVNDLNTARHQLGHSGTSTDALAFGGALSPTTNKTEDWNGVSWQETADMSTSRGYPASSGTAAAALAVGGTIPPGASTNATEEWNVPSNVVKTLTD